MGVDHIPWVPRTAHMGHLQTYLSGGAAKPKSKKILAVRFRY